jgi:hypothetical protein
MQEPIIKYNTIKVNGDSIKVSSYLPIEKKKDLIMISLQQSADSGFYNPIDLEAYFYVNVVKMYTDIKFDENEDMYTLYDSLETNGIIDAVVAAIPEDEFKYVYNNLIDIRKKKEDYENSFSGVANALLSKIPLVMEDAAKMVENFDPKKYQAVIDFATAANGNRPIGAK